MKLVNGNKNIKKFGEIEFTSNLYWVKNFFVTILLINY